MAGVTREEATAQVRRTISAYRDRVHEVRNDTRFLPPEGAQIVNEYCSFDNDWQDLVQEAVRETSFLDGMDDGLLLEYCAVCKELDEALGLGSWRIGRVDSIVGNDKDICETVQQHNGGVAKGGFAIFIFHIVQKIIENCSKNKLSNSRRQELDKQLENINNKNLTTLVINVPPNKEVSIWEDSVEYHCNINKMGNVINIKNQYEYDYILRRIPNKILDLVITGAHGNGRKLGKINPIGTKYDTCLNLSINIYLPDCYMGSETLMAGYSKYFGENAIIYARNYATWEQGVARFVEIVTTQSGQYDSSHIQADFNEHVKRRNQF